MPLTGDIDGDGLADLVIWRASNGTWYWLTSSSGYSYAAYGAVQWGCGAEGDVPILADMDNDGKSDPVVWRAGRWYWLTSSTGYSYASFETTISATPAPGDVPRVGDVDGDGRADLAIWQTHGDWNHYWRWSLSFAGYETWDRLLDGIGEPIRDPSDVPIAADLDGDGRVDLALWRASSGTYYWHTSSTAYEGYLYYQQWGVQSEGDVPVIGDFDGDGKGDLAVWRASTGVWYWLNSSSEMTTYCAVQWGWGVAGDVPMVR